MTGQRIAVLGAGAWGTALACAFAHGDTVVPLWGRDAGAMAEAAAKRENVARLPGIALPAGVEPGSDLQAAVAGADLVVAVVPTQALRSLARDLARAGVTVPVVLCCKGIERDTGLFVTGILADALPGVPHALLSGPSFAHDVGRGLPTAVTVAAPRLEDAARYGAQLGSPGLRLYHTDDVRGVEIGGASKNVLAIACGIAAGRGLGASAVAALIARAFAELSRFGRALGARGETLGGLSGLGDLVLTCNSPQSRNFSYGMALGRGERPDPRKGAVVEGVWTAQVLSRLANEHEVDMPIAQAVTAVLEGGLSIDDAIERLLNRPLRAEV